MHAKIKSLIRMLVAFLPALILIVSGCAPQPQSIIVKPLVDARSQPIGNNRVLVLTVTDRRPQTTLGNLSANNKQQIPISSRSDVTQAVQQALSERLQASGFHIVKPASTAALVLHIDIQRIDYAVSRDPLTVGLPINIIAVNAVLRAVARKQNRMLSGQYQANSTRRQLGYPSAVDNELLLNNVLAEALRQLLHDPELTAFLATS